MKKINILLSSILVLGLLVIPNASIAYNYNSLDSLARDMVDISINDKGGYEIYGSNLNEVDVNFWKKFDQLSIDEKNAILKKMREYDRMGVFTEASQMQEDFIKILEEYGKRKGKSLIDLTEKEIGDIKKALRMNRAWGMQDGFIDCKSAYFPDIVYFRDIPSWATPYSGNSVEAVRNSYDEKTCDYAIQFPISSGNITASSIRGRNLLRTFGGKLNKQTHMNGDVVIVGAGRADVLYGMITFSGAETGNRLRQELQLWK